MLASPASSALLTGSGSEPVGPASPASEPLSELTLFGAGCWCWTDPAAPDNSLDRGLPSYLSSSLSDSELVAVGTVDGSAPDALVMRPLWSDLICASLNSGLLSVEESKMGSTMGSPGALFFL